MARQHYFHELSIPPEGLIHPRLKPWCFVCDRIELLKNNGSDEPVFDDNESQVLAGLSFAGRSHRDLTNIKRTIDELAEQYKKLSTLVQPRFPRGLFTAYNKLVELHEAGSSNLFASADLRPLAAWTTLITKEHDELIEHFTDTLDEGPFANCIEIPVVPFDGSDAERSEGSIVEIPEDQATEENIENDINLAVERSSGAYLVESDRITDFIVLKERLAAQYGADKIRILRTLRPKWHPLPWYGIEIEQPGGEPMLVLESPIYGNATYHINNDDWPGTIEFNRTDAKQLGAKALPHTDGAIDHGDKLYNAVRKDYKDDA